MVEEIKLRQFRQIRELTQTKISGEFHTGRGGTRNPARAGDLRMERKAKRS
jgi:hypothetical protein